MYQVLSQDLSALMKLETKNEFDISSEVGENIDIGIARACGQYICMISKRILSNAKTNMYQQRLMESIELIEVEKNIKNMTKNIRINVYYLAVVIP